MQLKRVDFAATAEYKYLANWKVVQQCFTKHKIDKMIPVERLAKCKMQDNLEFLQWCRKYWDQYYPGGEYDAAGRRSGAAGAAAAGPNLSASVSSSAAAGGHGGRSASATSAASSNNVRRAAARPAAAQPTAPATRAPASTSSTAPRAGAGGPRLAGAAPNAAAAQQAQQQNAALQAELQTMTDSVQGLEKERDFYFNKLREIEILIQQVLDANPEAATLEGGILTQIQEAMYSTEEGFEVPNQDDPSSTAAADSFNDNANGGLALDDKGSHAHDIQAGVDALHFVHSDEDPDEVF